MKMTVDKLFQMFCTDEEKHSEDDIIRLKLYDITKSLGGFHYGYFFSRVIEFIISRFQKLQLEFFKQFRLLLEKKKQIILCIFLV